MLPAILWQKKLQKNDILPAAGDKEALSIPKKEAPLGPPKGGGKAPLGPPKGGKKPPRFPPRGGRKAPLGPPKGGKKPLSIPPRWGRVSLGHIGLMGLIGLISLIVEPYGSPKGGEYL